MFRPRKPPPLHRTRMLQDDDPYLVSNMAESILPLIPERNGTASTSSSSSRLHHPQGTQVGVVQYPWVKYGGRSPKFIWASCHVMCTAVLIGRNPRNSLPPPAFGLVLRGCYWSAKLDDISL
jgi:hypothetical protein